MFWHGTVPEFPELYDQLHCSMVSDISLYKDLCHNKELVLECGVGSGRVAIPLARAGCTIHGIDNSRDMLKACEMKLLRESEETQSRLQLHMADMRSFDLDLRFDAALVPFMTFNYLKDLTEQRNALRSIRRHLITGSSLSLELMSMFPPWFHNDGIVRFIRRDEDPETGETLEMSRLTSFNASTQVMQHDRYFRKFDSKGKLTEERRTVLRNRFFFLGEAELLLEACGFAISDVWGNHARETYTSDSPIMIIDARAA